MKNSSLKFGLPYFFQETTARQDLIRYLPAAMRLESKRQRTEGILRDILRWADDGGQTPEPGNLLARSNPDTARRQPNE